MGSLQYFATNYLLLLGLIFFSFGIGWIFFSLILRKASFINTSNFFIYVAEKCIFGITIIISCIALYYTKGITVQIISLVALVALLFYSKKNNQIENEFIILKPNWKDYVIIFIISFLIYLFHYYSSYLPDFVFYGKLSKSLIKIKSESTLILYDSYGIHQQLSLYHFGELWLNGFISKIFSLNSIFSLQHIIYPFFHLLAFFILLGYISLKVSNMVLSIVISVGFLYGSTFLMYPILSPEQGHYTFWFYGLPDISSFKTLLIYPYVLLGLMYYKEEKLEAFLWSLLVCATMFFTTWIAITGGLILLVLLQIFKKEFAHVWKILFCVACLFVLFLFPSLFNQNETNGSIGIVHHIYPISHYFINYKEYLLRFVDYFYRPFMLYPFALIGCVLGYKFFTKTDKKVLLFLLFCILSSVFFITFFYSFRESTQALSNILAPIMIFATYLCWDSLSRKKQLVFSIVLCLFAVLNIYKTYSFCKEEITFTEYEKKLYDFSQKNLQCQNWAYYSEKYWSTFGYSGNIVSSPILLSENTLMPIEIAPVFDTCSTEYYKRNVMYPLKNIHNSVPELLHFFNENSIQYIYIENIDIVPIELKRYINPILIENKKGMYEIIYTHK